MEAVSWRSALKGKKVCELKCLCYKWVRVLVQNQSEAIPRAASHLNPELDQVSGSADRVNPRLDQQFGPQGSVLDPGSELNHGNTSGLRLVGHQLEMNPFSCLNAGSY